MPALSEIMSFDFLQETMMPAINAMVANTFKLRSHLVNKDVCIKNVLKLIDTGITIGLTNG